MMSMTKTNKMVKLDFITVFFLFDFNIELMRSIEFGGASVASATSVEQVVNLLGT